MQDRSAQAPGPEDRRPGEEVVRSAEAMGDPGEDDLTVRYEDVEVDVAAMTDDTAYVDAVTGVLAYDLATGERTVLPEGEEPPAPPAAQDASVLVQARGAIETAAAAYATELDHSDHYILFWRNRAPALPAVFEDLLARQVNAFLVQVGRTYLGQLAIRSGWSTAPRDSDR